MPLQMELIAAVVNAPALVPTMTLPPFRSAQNATDRRTTPPRVRRLPVTFTQWPPASVVRNTAPASIT